MPSHERPSTPSDDNRELFPGSNPASDYGGAPRQPGVIPVVETEHVGTPYNGDTPDVPTTEQLGFFGDKPEPSPNEIINKLREKVRDASKRPESIPNNSKPNDTYGGQGLSPEAAKQIRNNDASFWRHLEE